jgi:hypothetical protein
MLDLAGLAGPVSRVLEIGPGSGRYMEKVIDALHPATYEVYETAGDWLPYLRSLPHALIQPCDGRTLRATASGGTVAFDLVTEGCMDEDTVAHWIGAGSSFRPVPRNWTVGYLAAHGLEYVGHHVSSMPPGTAELLVFRRPAA